MTLAELSQAWNDLRNAAWGRGSEPLVSRPLAIHIDREWADFRAWYEKQGTLGELAPSASAAEWIGRYRVALDALKAEGKTPATVLPSTFPEDVTRAADAVADTGRRAWGALELGFAALVIGVPIALAFAIATGRRGR